MSVCMASRMRPMLVRGSVVCMCSRVGSPRKAELLGLEHESGPMLLEYVMSKGVWVLDQEATLVGLELGQVGVCGIIVGVELGQGASGNQLAWIISHTGPCVG